MGNFLSCGFGHGNFFCRGKLLTMWFWSWKFFWTCDLGHGNFGHVILVMGIFWTCDFGYGNFLGMENFFCHGKFLIMWFWSWKIFWTCDLGHGNFGHVILVMGIFWTCDFGHGNFFLDMWFWAWEFLRHVIFRA